MKILNSQKWEVTQMGDRIRVLTIVVAVLLLGSFGLYQESFAITADEINEKIKINDSVSRPTFGIDHYDSTGIVDNGFRFNGNTFSITDNYHTPFAKQSVKLGEVNSFEAKVYVEKKLKVQEFLFGIPQKGEAHLAELGIEVWYGLFGEIQDIKVIQKTNVIDIDSLTVTHEKAKCLSSDTEDKCDTTKVSVVFLEPLKDKVMAIKAIDYKNRYQITYLNEGFDISGASLNPMATKMYASTAKYEGLIPVTQTEKYSKFWTAEDGRIFEKNNFDSFQQINQSFERFQDTGEPRTRLHSGFAGVMAYEHERAIAVFDSSELISELPESFEYSFPESKERIYKELKEKIAYEHMRATGVFDSSELISELPDYVPYSPPKISEKIDKEMKEKMLEQEKIAQSILNKNTNQLPYTTQDDDNKQDQQGMNTDKQDDKQDDDPQANDILNDFSLCLVEGSVFNCLNRL